MDASTSNDYKKRWWALIGLGMALVILNLDLTVVNLALPVLGHDFHANLSTLQWINNIYSLTFAALVALCGKVADRHGHKTMYLYGVSFFLLGSLVAGFAPNLDILILGRFLQGLGMAGTFGMIFILTNAAFPPDKRGFATGMLVVFVGVAQALGPTIGGSIVEHWGWRYAFLINVPFCIISIIIVRLACINNSNKQQAPVHALSASALIAAYFILVLAFNQMGQWGVTHLAFISCVVIGLILFIGTLLKQHSLKAPYFDTSLFHNNNYKYISLVRPLFQFCFGAFFFVLPLYLQNIVGMSPGLCGVVMLIMTVALAASSIIVGKLNDKISARPVLLVAHIGAIIGYGLLALLPLKPINWAGFSIALILLGINVGIMYSTTNYVAINSLPADKKGIGFGFFSANAYFFYSIGIALAGYMLSTISYAHFNHWASLNHVYSSLFNNTQVLPYINGARPLHTIIQIADSSSPVLYRAAEQAFRQGFSAINWLFVAFSALGLALSMRIKNRQPTPVY